MIQYFQLLFSVTPNPETFPSNKETGGSGGGRRIRGRGRDSRRRRRGKCCKWNNNKKDSLKITYVSNNPMGGEGMEIKKYKMLSNSI